jgi:hypothetical protein
VPSDPKQPLSLPSHARIEILAGESERRGDAGHPDPSSSSSSSTAAAASDRPVSQLHDQRPPPPERPIGAGSRGRRPDLVRISTRARNSAAL